MKQLLTLSIIMMLGASVSAQKSNSDPRYRQYAGRYGNLEGICLFNDGRFMLYGYATAVFGTYGFEKDYLLFYPERPELFEVYASRNKEIGDSLRMNFMGFEEAGTFIQLGTDSVYQVFNDDANCFGSPYIWTTPKKYSSLTLSNKTETTWQYIPGNNSWRFPIGAGNNDFILVYNEPHRYYEQFSGMMEKGRNGTTALKLSHYGNGENGYIKQDPDEAEKEQWQELLEWKEQYYHSNEATNKAVFANKHYNTFQPPDTLYYVYDTVSNLYISKQAAANEEYFRNEQYNDDRYLREYRKIQGPEKGSFRFRQEDMAASSIFYTVCGEGTRPSYQYNGYDVYTDEEQIQAPVTADSAIPMDMNPVSAGFTSFTVEREDGLYIVEKADPDNYSKPLLSEKPSLKKTDIADARIDYNESGMPVVKILLTEEGRQKFEILTIENTGNPIAIVSGKKVISMPVITGPIKTGEVDIAGLHTLEEAKNIATQLKQK